MGGDRHWRHLLPALALSLAPVAGCDDDGAGEQASKSSTPPVETATGGSEPEAASDEGVEPAAAEADTADSAEPSDAEGIFYKVEGDDGTAYVLGSVHVAKPELYPLRAEIREAFDESGALALELELDQGSLGAMAQKLLAAAKYPPGESLEDHLEPKTLELYEKHKSKAGPMAGMLGQFKPWFVAMTLVSSVLQKHGYSQQHGIDMHFQQQIGDRESVPLETVQQQISLFESLDEDTQDLMLRETLEEIDQLAENMEEAFAAWKKGDAEQIETILLDMKDDERYRPVYEDMILRRNEKMADKVQSYLQNNDETLFVVIGAAHVVGEGGIVAQLEDEGYEADEL